MDDGDGLDVLAAAALALDVRPGERTRTAKDMDLVRGDQATEATSDLISASREDARRSHIGRDLESLRLNQRWSNPTADRIIRCMLPSGTRQPILLARSTLCRAQISANSAGL